MQGLRRLVDLGTEESLDGERMSEVQRYRRKPEKRTDDSLSVVKYEPGEPLDDLLHVAQMASKHAELAEVPLPSGTVLLVRHVVWRHDEPFTEWEVVEAGRYLAYGHGTDSLFDTDDAALRQWYERA